MKTPKVNIKAALMKAGANAAGAAGAAYLNKIEFVGKQKPLFRGLGKMVIAALLPSIAGKGKSAGVVNDVAAGMNAVAGIEIINGILTKNGQDPTKAISIAGIGDVDANIMGPDATYIIDDTAAGGGNVDDNLM